MAEFADFLRLPILFLYLPYPLPFQRSRAGYTYSKVSFDARRNVIKTLESL